VPSTARSSGCSGSSWSRPGITSRSTTNGVRLLCQDSATAPNDRGALVIDDTGDRKDGTATAHVARQYLGSVGKVDNGIVAVTSLWADERCYWPVHAVPYTPAVRLPGGERDPGFHTKPQLAVELVQAAQQAGIRFRAVVADCFYGDNPASPMPCWPPRCRSCWRSSPAGAPGRRPTKPTPRSRRPASSAGAAPPDRDAGDASSVASATATPRPGGRPTPSSAAGARIGRCGWWWPPPTQAAARARDLVSADQPAVSQEPPHPAGRPG
jgi:DDE superfamily endonuclease